MNGFRKYFPSIYVKHSKGVGGSLPMQQHGKDSWYVLYPSKNFLASQCFVNVHWLCSEEFTAALESHLGIYWAGFKYWK